MAVQTDNTILNALMDKLDTLSNNATSNVLFLAAKDSFLQGLESFTATELEKMSAYADFMSKTFSAQFDIIFRGAMALDGEVAKVEKTKHETRLVHETTVLTMEQINSERLRQQDTKAGISLKNQQNLVTFQSALTEESRRLVLLKANNDNAKIKESEHMVNYMKVISDDDTITLTESIHTAVKTNIENITQNNLLTISNALPSDSTFIGQGSPEAISADITKREESDFLEITNG